MKLSKFSPAGVWGLLVVLTLVSVGVFEGGWFGQVSSVLAILLAALKSRLVMRNYMETTRAARHWRFLFETWNFAVVAAILIGFALSLN